MKRATLSLGIAAAMLSASQGAWCQPHGKSIGYGKKISAVEGITNVTGHPPIGLTGAGTDLPFFETSLFAGSGVCQSCHDFNGDALTDSEGNDVSPPNNWRSTMMANAFRDPLFRAKMEQEAARYPQLSTTIEDKCLTCHAPMAREQALADGDTELSLSEALASETAHDGVSCTLCHQIQPGNLGTPDSFSGNFVITDERKIFGPYNDVYASFMINSVDYEPVEGLHMTESGLCGSCHTLYTPILDDDGNTVGQFPEQTPYLEWLNSSYVEGTDAIQKQGCQECHMPLILNEEIKIASFPGFVGGKTPFWRHHFVGGNVYMLRMIKDYAVQLGATAEPAQFDATIQRTLDQLQQRSVSLTIDAAVLDQATDTANVIVRVKNLTGHKLPTSFVARRMWLHLTVTDALSTVIFESGRPDADGEIIGLDATFEPHHDVITNPEDVQVYEAVTGDVHGALTWSLLRAASYLKDNRIPPHGWQPNGPYSQDTAIYGVPGGDTDFHQDGHGGYGSGEDRVTYRVLIPKSAKGPLTVTVRALYQSVQPRFADDVGTHGGAQAQQFKTWYEARPNDPIEMGSAAATLNPPVDLGVVVR